MARRRSWRWANRTSAARIQCLCTLGCAREPAGEFKARLARGQALEQLLPEAFATVREASRRVLGLRHFDSQMVSLHGEGGSPARLAAAPWSCLPTCKPSVHDSECVSLCACERVRSTTQIGGMVLNAGAVAEMCTGEGKTLVATLPAYLNALRGRCVPRGGRHPSRCQSLSLRQPRPVACSGAIPRPRCAPQVGARGDGQRLPGQPRRRVVSA